MKVFAITCTGDRPAAFALCQKYLEQQTRKPNLWLVVDDGQDRGYLETTLKFHRIGASLMQGHSLDRNLGLAFEFINQQVDLDPTDLVVFAEDDDYYAPDYIEKIVQAHRDESLEVVGEEKSIYYNLQHRRFKELSGRPYAALCQTSFKARMLSDATYVLDRFQTPVETFDVAFWRYCVTNSAPRRLIPGEPSVVGIKGMPGRPGIGRGHYVENLSEWSFDPAFEKLRQAIKSEEDYGRYCEISRLLQKESDPATDAVSEQRDIRPGSC